MSIAIAAIGFAVFVVLLYVFIRRALYPNFPKDSEVCISIEERKEPQESQYYIVKNRFGPVEDRVTDPGIPSLMPYSEPEPESESEPEPKGKFIEPMT